MLPLPKRALKETVLVDIPSASAIVSNISNPTYKEATKKRIYIYIELLQSQKMMFNIRKRWDKSNEHYGGYRCKACQGSRGQQ